MPSTTPTLDREEILAHVRRRCFGRDGSGAVGIEIELLTFPAGHPNRRPPASDLLAATEGCQPGRGGLVTLEPGGQVELSSAPQPGLRAALEATAADLRVLRRALDATGIATRAQGLDPLRPTLRVLDDPRYQAMDAYFSAYDDRTAPRSGPFALGAGHLMMCNTASLQLNVDLGPAPLLPGRWRLAHALGPVLIAAFANSPRLPYRSGEVAMRSSRQLVWAAIDPSRSAPAPVSLDPAVAWTTYALDARVMLVRDSDARFEPVRSELTFRNWVEGGYRGCFPTLDDLDYHLTTLFPPVRPRGWLELRVIDSLPDPWWQVAAAVTVALLDDPVAADVAARVCASVHDHWFEAACDGLTSAPLAAAARACFAAALDALPRLDCPLPVREAAADYAARYVGRGRSPADDLLEEWARGDAVATVAAPLVADPLPGDAPAA